MAEDDKLIITAEEAEGLLPEEGEYIHNYANPSGGMFLGIDYERADAIAAFKSAKQIEIAGPGAKSMKHPIAVWDENQRLTFFEADMAKVEAFEAKRASP